MCSTSYTSYSNFCSQRMALRPFTRAHPVIPGFTSWRLAWRALYNGRYSTSNGRGPTRLISPFITFSNCGISSMESFLIHCPTSVSLSPSGNNSPSRPRLSFMVLNLMMRKILPCTPGLRWKKNTLPLLATNNAMQAARKTGSSTINAMAATKKSPAGFMIDLYTFY